MGKVSLKLQRQIRGCRKKQLMQRNEAFKTWSKLLPAGEAKFLNKIADYQEETLEMLARHWKTNQTTCKALRESRAARLPLV